MPEIGFVSVFCPLTTTGDGELVFQNGEMRFVKDCRVNPAELVGHIKNIPAGAKQPGGALIVRHGDID